MIAFQKYSNSDDTLKSLKAEIKTGKEDGYKKQYTTKAVAIIDILGMSDKMKKSKDSDFDDIYDIMETLHKDTKSFVQDIFVNREDCRFIQLGDSIVLITDEKIYPNFYVLWQRYSGDCFLITKKLLVEQYHLGTYMWNQKSLLYSGQR
jgi:hypothetical protein